MIVAMMSMMVTVAFGAIVQGILGFGCSIVWMSIFPLFTSIPNAVGIIKPLGIGLNILLLQKNHFWRRRRQHSSNLRDDLKPLAITAPIGIIFGLWVIIDWPTYVINALLGIFLLLYVVNSTTTFCKQQQQEQQRNHHHPSQGGRRRSINNNNNNNSSSSSSDDEGFELSIIMCNNNNEKDNNKSDDVVVSSASKEAIENDLLSQNRRRSRNNIQNSNNDKCDDISADIPGSSTSFRNNKEMDVVVIRDSIAEVAIDDGCYCDESTTMTTTTVAFFGSSLSSSPTVLCAGFFGGCLTSAFSTPGPAILVYAREAQWDVESPEKFRANLQLIFLSMNILAITGLIFEGIINVETIQISVMLLPALVFGGWSGSRLATRMRKDTFRIFVLCGISSMGVILISKALFLYMEQGRPQHQPP